MGIGGNSLSTTDLQWRMSGGAANIDYARSTGGPMSTVDGGLLCFSCQCNASTGAYLDDWYTANHYIVIDGIGDVLSDPLTWLGAGDAYFMISQGRNASLAGIVDTFEYVIVPGPESDSGPHYVITSFTPLLQQIDIGVDPEPWETYCDASSRITFMKTGALYDLAFVPTDSMAMLLRGFYLKNASATDYLIEPFMYIPAYMVPRSKLHWHPGANYNDAADPTKGGRAEIIWGISTGVDIYGTINEDLYYPWSAGIGEPPERVYDPLGLIPTGVSWSSKPAGQRAYGVQNRRDINATDATSGNLPPGEKQGFWSLQTIHPEFLGADPPPDNYHAFMAIAGKRE